MPNTVLNPTIIAKAAVRLLDNELVMANRVFRGYENEFEKKVNGYDIGDTVTIRKPNQFTVRSVIAASIQDVVEGKQTFTVNSVRGVDFSFSSTDLTLKISELADRVIRPAMIQLANAIDADLMSLYTQVPQWVGQPATGADAAVDSYSKFTRAAERMDELAVPQDERVAILGPNSYWGMAGSQAALQLQSIGSAAYRKGSIGEIGGIDTYMSQNVPTYTAGTGADASVTVNGAAQQVTYAAIKDTESVPGTQTLITAGWGASTTITAGTVFTIANVFAVNPVTKAVLPFLQHFTVVTALSADGAGAATVTISPAIIVSGAFQTVNSAPANGAAIVVAGGASLNYRQNLMFHKNAFGLVTVPMVKPPGAVSCTRESYKGLSVRLIPYYDGTNDVSSWRLDVLYGKKALDPRLAVRFGGGSGTI